MTVTTTSRNRKQNVPFTEFVRPAFSVPKTAEHPEIPSEVPEQTALDDEVVILGRQLSAAWEAAETLENKRFAAHETKAASDKVYHQRAVQHAYDEVYALSSMLTVRKAKTLCGAAMQIAEALSLIDALTGTGEGDDAAESQHSDDLRAINRLLYSVLDVVDRAAEQKLAVVAPRLRSKRCDPWLPVEEQRSRASGKH